MPSSAAHESPPEIDAVLRLGVQETLAAGNRHIVVMDAFELRDGDPSGYQCAITSDPEDDLLGLLGRLVGKLRRMLSVKHLTGDEAEAQIADKPCAAESIGMNPPRRARACWSSTAGKSPGSSSAACL